MSEFLDGLAWFIVGMILMMCFVAILSLAWEAASKGQWPLVMFVTIIGPALWAAFRLSR